MGKVKNVNPYIVKKKDVCGGSPVIKNTKIIHFFIIMRARKKLTRN